MPEVYGEFLTDLLKTGGISPVGLSPAELMEIPDVILNVKLDFDDAYQYVISKNYNMILVTFDNDFKRSGVQCKRPSEILSLQTDTPSQSEDE